MLTDVGSHPEQDKTNVKAVRRSPKMRTMEVDFLIDGQVRASNQCYHLKIDKPK